MGVVTLSVSTSRTATLGAAGAGGSAEASGLDTAVDGATTVVAAIELMRKWRLFMGDFPFGFGVVISIFDSPEAERKTYCSNICTGCSRVDPCPPGFAAVVT